MLYKYCDIIKMLRNAQSLYSETFKCRVVMSQLCSHALPSVGVVVKTNRAELEICGVVPARACES